MFISSILDILSKAPLGYPNEEILNHKLRKRKLEAERGKVGSPIAQGEMSLPLLLKPPGKAGQLLCELGTVCPDKKSHK